MIVLSFEEINAGIDIDMQTLSNPAPSGCGGICDRGSPTAHVAIPVAAKPQSDSPRGCMSYFCGTYRNRNSEEGVWA